MNPAGVETIHKLHNGYVKCTTVCIILQLFVQLHCKYEPLYILNVTSLSYNIVYISNKYRSTCILLDLLDQFKISITFIHIC